jgi:phospholipase C
MRRHQERTSGRLLLFVVLLAATALLSGCGSSAANPIHSPTVTLNASPTTITAGTSATLAWTSSNGASASISNGVGSVPLSGSMNVTPSQTTTYTITVTGSGTTTATAQATVTVSSVAGGPTVAMSANPASITAGQSSTLTVTATNATTVAITDNLDSSKYSLPATGGTQSVSPTSTTIYTVTATGTNSQTATAQVTVTVTAVAGPTVTISANPTSITGGQSTTLTVTATNATTVVITDNTDSNSYTLAANGGTQIVKPAATTTYTATATGANNQTATSQVTVTVTAAPTVTISANPTSITAGQSTTLAVSATNANTVVITDNTDSNSYTLAANGGTQIVKPPATTTYTATATGANNQTVTATVTVNVTPVVAAPTVSITANPGSITSGQSTTLTVSATNANTVVITDNVDSNSYSLGATGGTKTVSPTANTVYTATATGANNQTATDSTTVTVSSGTGSVTSINHVIFMMQENRSFDTYFGMLNPYRQTQHLNIGDDNKVYDVDGIDDKLTTIKNFDDEGAAYSLFKFATTCIDEESSAWLESYGDVNRYDFSTTRPIGMDGFVHNAEGLANSCAKSGNCVGDYSDLTGRRAMGYYDQGFLNYYYFMASQFALSDRWFSTVSSKSAPNRVATFTGGTTQGLVRDSGNDDHLSQLNIPSIFQELDQAKVTWKVYYTVTDNSCFASAPCSGPPSGNFPATTLAYLSYSYQYLYEKQNGAACTGTTQSSNAVGDPTDSFCIDLNHVAPLSYFYNDLTKGTLPSFAFVEAGFGRNDEHPGSSQSILDGQAQIAYILNYFMNSPSWKDSVFFLSYDEGGGPYDHVPPVPGHSNDFTTNPVLGTIPDISQIAVNADGYKPCVPSGGTPTLHCDLATNDPGAKSNDAPAVQGFAAQLGFRVPNMIVSPFTRKHYVSHTPMDHTAVIKFVENRFLGSSAHLTPRDAAQPNLLEFFDFNAVPWTTPPSPPAPFTSTTSCTPKNMGP